MPLAHKHIVIIEDSHAILTSLRITLEALGAKVSGAATASGGMAIWESDQPDIVILDLGLPDKDGFDIIQRLKRMDKDGNRPIIVLTARHSQEDKETALGLGADAYITKPFEMDTLLEVIYQKLGLPPLSHAEYCHKGIIPV